MIVKFDTIQIIFIYICASNIFDVFETIYAKALAINTTIENETPAKYYLPLISDVPSGSQDVYNSDKIIHIPIQTDKIDSDMKPSLLQIPLQNLKLLHTCKTSCYGNGENSSSKDTQILPIGVELPPSISSEEQTDLEPEISSITSENISSKKELIPLKMPTKISNIEFVPIIVKETKNNKLPIIVNKTSKCKTNVSLVNLQELQVPNIKVNAVNVIPIQTETQLTPVKAIKIPTQTDDVHIISHKYTGSQMMIPVDELNKPQIKLQKVIIPKTVTKKIFHVKKIKPEISTYGQNITIEKISMQPQTSRTKIIAVKPVKTIKTITSIKQPKTLPVKIKYTNISKIFVPSTLKPLILEKKPLIIKARVPVKKPLKILKIKPKIFKPKLLRILPKTKTQTVSTVSPSIITKKPKIMVQNLVKKKPIQIVQRPTTKKLTLANISKPMPKISTVKPILSTEKPKEHIKSIIKISQGKTPNVSNVKSTGIIPIVEKVKISKQPSAVKPVNLSKKPQFFKQVTPKKQIISPITATIKPIKIPVYKTIKPTQILPKQIPYPNISKTLKTYQPSRKPVISNQVTTNIKPVIEQKLPLSTKTTLKVTQNIPKIYHISKPLKHPQSVISQHAYPTKKPLIITNPPTLKLPSIATIKPLKLTTVKPTLNKYLISKPKKILPLSTIQPSSIQIQPTKKPAVKVYKKLLKNSNVSNVYKKLSPSRPQYTTKVPQIGKKAPIIRPTIVRPIGKVIPLSTTVKPSLQTPVTLKVLNIPASPSRKPLPLKMPIKKIKFESKPLLVTTIKPKAIKLPIKKPILPIKQKVIAPNVTTTSLISTKHTLIPTSVGLKFSNISYPIKATTNIPLQSTLPIKIPQTPRINASPLIRPVTPILSSPILTTAMPLSTKMIYPNISRPVKTYKLPSILKPSTKPMIVMTTARPVLITTKQIKKLKKKQNVVSTKPKVILKKPKSNAPYLTKKPQILPTQNQIVPKIVQPIQATRKPIYQKRKLFPPTKFPQSKPPVGISRKPIVKSPVISQPLQPIPSNVSTSIVLSNQKLPVSSPVQFKPQVQSGQTILKGLITPIQNASQPTTFPTQNEKTNSPSISLFPGSNFYPPLNIYNFYPYYRQPCLRNKIPLEESLVNTSYPYNLSLQPYPNQAVPLMKKLYPFKPGVPVLIDKAKAQIPNNIPYNERIPVFDPRKMAPTNYLPCPKPGLDYPYTNDKLWQKQGDYQLYPYPYPYTAPLSQPCYRTVPSSCH